MKKNVSKKFSINKRSAESNDSKITPPENTEMIPPKTTSGVSLNIMEKYEDESEFIKF